MSLRLEDVTLVDPAPEGPRVIEATSVRVADGRIEETGAGLPGADVEIDGQGGLLVPGLVNAHTHCAMTLLRGWADDLSLEAWLRDRIWPAEAHLTPEAVRAGSLLGIAEAHAAGITGMADMYLFEDAVAEAAHAARMRLLAGASIVDFETPEDPADEALDRAEELLEAYPPDGDGLVSASVAPHSTYTCSGETLAACAELADEHEARLQTHASETRREVYRVEQETGNRPVAQLAEHGALTERTLVAHCGWVTKEEAREIADAGASAIHCPTANMKLATGGYAPVPELVEAGARVGLGTDGPASNNTIDLLQEAKRAALVHKHHRWEAEILPAEQVLAMATRIPAHACGFEGSGRLVEGARADLALVDTSGAHMAPMHDPVSQLVYAAGPGDVRSTVVDGELVYHDGEHRTLDLAEVRREAEAEAGRLVDAAGVED